MKELKIVLCGGGVTSEVKDKLHLYFVECREIGGVVLNGKVGDEFSENLCKKKEYVQFMKFVT